MQYREHFERASSCTRLQSGSASQRTTSAVQSNIESQRLTTSTSCSLTEGGKEVAGNPAPGCLDDVKGSPGDTNYRSCSTLRAEYRLQCHASMSTVNLAALDRCRGDIHCTLQSHIRTSARDNSVHRRAVLITTRCVGTMLLW